MPQTHATLPLQSRNFAAPLLLIAPAALLLGLLSHQPVMAQETVVIADGDIVTEQQVLDGNGDRLIVEDGGTLDVADLDAVFAEGDDVVITNDGIVNGGSDGIDTGGANALVTNNGVITAVNDGIEVDGAGGVVTNNGTIDADVGVFSDGGNVAITNSGTLLADGTGIDSDGDNAVIVNTEGITVTDQFGEGITTSGLGSVVTNSGTIIASEGVFSTNEAVQISNSGRIDASFIGINSTGANAEITNSGVIDSERGGIEASGFAAVVSNSGSIVSDGDGIAAIQTGGANAVVTNSGSITMTDDETRGIRSFGNDTQITNSGRITMTDLEGRGIVAFGDNSTVVNSGHIATSGAVSFGVAVLGDNSVVTNDGAVVTVGDDSDGVELRGLNAALINTGVISATGTGSFAVSGDSGSQSVTLGGGSRIIGVIDLGADDDTASIMGISQSSVMTMQNVETLIVAEDVAVFDVGDATSRTVTTIDVTGPAVLGHAAAVLADHTHRGVQTDTDGAWASLIGAARSRGDDGKVLAHDHRFAGALAGYNLDLGANRLGIVAGVSSSQIETDEDSTSVDSEGFFAGAYLTRPFGNVALTAGLIAGVESHDSERDVLDNLAGEETATASFDSQFISATVTAEMGAFTLGALELRPSAMAAYTVSSIDGYTEEDTTNANLRVDSRTAQTLTTRAQLETVTALANVDLAYRFGIDGRFSNEDDIAINLADQSQNFAAGDSETVLGGFLGGQARFAPADGLQLIGDVEYGFADGEEQTLGASLNVSFAF